MYLGIDIGTSSVKVVLMDGEQLILGSAGGAYPVSRPHPGWSEQNSEDWWKATVAAVDELAAKFPGKVAAVTGIGLSGHMHGATLLDKADKALRPCILWNDVRSAVECGELEAASPAFRAKGGNIVMPGFTAPKLAWVRKFEPEIFAKVAKVLLPKDHVRLRLVGDYVGEMSDAAGTLWLDVGKRDWSDEMLASTGLDRSHMPRLVEGSEPSGELLPELKARWGMTGKVAVAGGGGDNAASACGIGAVKPGAAFASLGTSGVLFVSNDRFSPNTDGAVHAFCHAVPNTWHQMGVVLSASDSLQWLSRVTGESAPQLTAALGASVSGPSSVLFMPYLSGERTPHNDATIRGGFVGIGHETDVNTLTQAVMEGVAYAFRDCRRVLNDAGTDFESAVAVGGGAQSKLWLKILASVLDRPLEIPRDGSVGAALGAARLGMAAATGDDPVSICSPQPIEAVIEPDPALVERYTRGYETYRRLYPAIKGTV